MTPDRAARVDLREGRLFESYAHAVRRGKRTGSVLWRVWWHHGDKVWWVPMWLWRPVCWFLRRAHTDDSYGSCVICRLDLDKARRVG